MSTPRLGQHAVVIGASVAGMLTAKVLTAHFDRVTVIERDSLPIDAAVRKGLPQAPHAHAFLVRGLQTVQRLFPGLTEDLVEHGALWADTGSDLYWYQFGVSRLRAETGLMGLLFSRPLLDWRMRTHLRREAGIAIRDGVRVKDLRFAADQRTVNGLVIESVAGGEPEYVDADLVVDCGGRGSQSSHWLETHGFGKVPVTEMKARVDYASCFVKRAPDGPDWKVGMICATPPETPLGIAIASENDQWVLTIQSMFGEALPGDWEGILAYLKALPRPELYEAMRKAEPVGPIYRHSTPSNLRRHFERLQRFPDGFVVLGDAVCSFNPRYGQGMTAAALSVDVLGSCLAAQPAGKIAGLSQRFQKQLNGALDMPWQVATGEDLRFPQVEGARPLPLRLINALLIKIFQLLSVDKEALVAFLQVQHILQPITVVLKPGILWRALTFKVPKTEPQRPGASVAER